MMNRGMNSGSHVTNTILSLLGLALSTIGGIGLGWSPPVKILFSDPAADVDLQYRTWYHGPSGEPARAWKAQLLADVHRGRRMTSLWLAVFVVGVVLTAIGLL